VEVEVVEEEVVGGHWKKRGKKGVTWVGMQKKGELDLLVTTVSEMGRKS